MTTDIKEHLRTAAAEPVAIDAFVRTDGYGVFHPLYGMGIFFTENASRLLYTHPAKTEQPSLTLDFNYAIQALRAYPNGGNIAPSVALQIADYLSAQRQDSEQSRLMLADDTSPRIPARQDSDKDAERYRWLRDHHPQSDVCGTDEREEFDAVVDRAIANGAPK